MKKLLNIMILCCLFIQMAGCKKEKTDPPAIQSTCDGSTWTYSVTASPAFALGSIQIQYFDGNMNTVVDTTLSGSWSKSVTAKANSQGQYSSNLTIMPGANYSVYYPSGFSSTVYLYLYKDGVEQTVTGSSAFCYDDVGNCSINTGSSFNKQAYCN